MNYLFVTLIFSEDYLEGAILVSLGLEYQQSKYEKCCLITPKITQKSRETLQQFFNFIIEIPFITTNTELKYEKIIINNEFFDCEKYPHIFTKLHIFNPEIYPEKYRLNSLKVCFIDADLMPLHGFDILFNLNTPAGWLTQIYELKENVKEPKGYTQTWGIWEDIKHSEKIPKMLTDVEKLGGSNINAGLLVITPNKKEYDEMIKEIQKPKKEWWGKVHTGCVSNKLKFVDYYEQPEEGYLTKRYSGKWHMIDGRFASWGKDVKKSFGIHMAALQFPLNEGNLYKKSWMIQFPISDGYNDWCNKLVLFGLKKYSILKDIFYQNLYIIFNNKTEKEKKIKFTSEKLKKEKYYSKLLPEQKEIYDLIKY